MARKRETGLTEEQAKHLAAKLQPFFERYGRNQTRMADAWGISQPQLGHILNANGRGAGVAVLCRIREHTGIPLDELLGLDPVGPTVDERLKTAVAESLGPVIEDRIRDALAHALDALEDTAKRSSAPPPPKSSRPRPRLTR